MGSAQQPGEPRPPGGSGTVEQPSDAELIAATRGGDTTAYGQLYERHVHAARKLGRILARDSAEADDLTSETFAKVLATLRAGRGPDLAFRAYLLTTLRNTFYDRTRRDKKVEFTDDMTRHDTGEEFIDTAVAGQERRYAARAFHRLPERWQVVLWHTEVEGESAAEVAPLLGLSPNGVSALAYRARERLRQMYLQEHIADSPAATCRWTADRLGARVRGGLSGRDETKVDQHLDECTACKLLFVELAEVNSGLRGVLAPVILGIAAPAYLGGTAVKSAVIAGWFTGVGAWVKDGANWVRRIVQKLGPRNTAIAGGTAAVAGVLALILVANNTTPPPEPPSQAQEQPPPEDDPPPDEQEEDEPPDDSPDDEPTDEEEREEDEEEPEEPPAPPSEFTVGADLTSADLTAGREGTLPITISAPESSTARVPTESARIPGGNGVPESDATPMTEGFGAARVTEADDRMTMTLTFDEGISSPGGDATDGWACEPGEGEVRCVRDQLKPGTSTTAEVPLDVAPEVTGFHDIEADVVADNLESSKTLRVPVAPVGMRTAYASNDATGVATAGNTLLTCEPTKVCDHGAADNHTSVMSGYTADGPPRGLDKHTAVSGARLDVPAGARILWAGLHWASSGHRDLPNVQISTPGGGWQTVSAQTRYSGIERPVRQSVAEITGMVWGSGEFWVAADERQLPDGPFHYAGWSITAVYQLPGEAPRETAVYEGLAQPRAEETLSVSLPGGGQSQLAYTLWDGDHTLGGDNLDIDGTTVGQPGNLGHGYSPSALEGEDWNTFGVDVDTGEATHGDNAHATIYTGSDPLEIGVLALVTPPP